jgi:SAM-dependent methyltransferase
MFHQKKLHFSVDMCQKCGHVYSKKTTNYNPYSSNMEKFYNRQYPNLENVNQYQKRQTKEILELFKEKETFHYIEVGCSDGLLFRNIVHHFQKPIQADLFELSPSANYLVNENINVHNVDITTFNIPLKADIVVMSHSLEHIYDLNTMILKLKKTLKKGGYLYIEVPDGLRVDTSISYPLGFYHLHNFSEYTLYFLLEKHGFCVTSIEARGNYPGIRAIAINSQKKSSSSTQSFESFSLLKSNLWFKNYQKARLDGINKIPNIDNKKVLIYGAGLHTKAILEFFPDWLENPNIEIVDRQYQNFQGYYPNKKVISIENINFAQYDYIIISSYSYQEEIKKNLLLNNISNEKIIQLYETIFAYYF